jgi:hypothetical protein
MTSDLARTPVVLDGEFTDVEIHPAVNPWVPALVFYLLPCLVLALLAYLLTSP